MYNGIKKTEIMLRFRSSFVDGEIVAPPTLVEYLKTLYEQHEAEIYPLVMKPNKIDPFTTEEIEDARRALAKGKAIGVDFLPDKYFKEDNIWRRI